MSVTNGATAALQHAKDFTKSVEGTETSQFAPKPSGQHADASYKAAAKAAPAAPASKPYNISNEAEDAGKGIKWNEEQRRAAEKQQ